MNKKQKLLLVMLAGVIVVQAGTANMVMQEYGRLHDRYVSLYETAAYLAGKAEASGLDIEAFDLVSLRALAPEEKKWFKKEKKHTKHQG